MGSARRPAGGETPGKGILFCHSNGDRHLATATTRHTPSKRLALIATSSQSLLKGGGGLDRDLAAPPREGGSP